MTRYVEGLAHLLLQVSDMQKAEQFYFGLLGLSVKSRDTFGGNRPLIVSHQGLGITLLPSSLPTPAPVESRNLQHVAFWTRDLDGLIDVLEAAGVPVEGPNPTPYGRSIYATDPDGNRIECIEHDEKMN